MLVGDWALASEGNFADPAVAAALVVTANVGRGRAQNATQHSLLLLPEPQRICLFTIKPATFNVSSQSYGEEWVMDFSDDVQKSQSRKYDIIFHFINGLVSFTTNIST